MRVIDNDDAIKEMCSNLKCTRDPEECEYAFNRLTLDTDCDGPYTETEEK